MVITNELKEKIASKVHEFAFIDPKQIPFMQYVVEACEKNYCGQYGKTWQCPPGVGDLHTLKERILAFNDALIFSSCNTLEDSFDYEGMTQARIDHEKLTDEVCLMFAGEKIRSFSAGGCKICKECTYPDAPCRFPDKARSSIEANGISVIDLARICGIKYHNGVNTVTYFSVIVFNGEEKE